MKRIGLLFVLMGWALLGKAQLTLEECYERAEANYPLIKQYGLVEQSREFNLSNASKGYLPQIGLSAGAYAFTDILDMPAQLGQVAGGMENHLLSASVTVNQSIYDGGAIAVRRGLAKAEAEVEKGQVEVSMYDVRQRIDQFYFGVLSIEEQLKQTLLLEDDLKLSLQTVEGLMRGGLANQSDVDAVRVEQIKANQRVGSLRTLKRTYLLLLGTFINQKLGEETTLVKPAASGSELDRNNYRPELNLYTAQSQLLDAQKRMLDAQLRPKLGAFATGMLHSKVTDIVNSGLLLGGISLSWNLGALYTRKTDLQKLELQRRQIGVTRETFLFNTQLQSESSDGVIQDLKAQLAQDAEIVTLREGIRDRAQRRVENGIETVNEMLREINAVSEARQTQALHEIQLLQEIYRMKHLYNN